MKELFKYISVFVIIIIGIVLVINTLVLVNADDKKESKGYSLKVIQKDSSWIYVIAKNDKVLIKQEYVPAVKGRRVFKSKEDAEIIGKLVLNKLYRNQTPRLTIDEVMSNSITFNNLIVE
ncbi:DUF4907 domain-containing protein [uncultured Winogradskyella sp.]|uniref:DUF4907 domain-containing protein n=1 Tax=uncultured Winogradskyella sp. TaxID=395353 RepID=UPI00260DD5AD|nr:DUF4907 domain-containing protein [uncultured Winogradskyella sp.]